MTLHTRQKKITLHLKFKCRVKVKQDTYIGLPKYVTKLRLYHYVIFKGAKLGGATAAHAPLIFMPRPEIIHLMDQSAEQIFSKTLREHLKDM